MDPKRNRGIEGGSGRPKSVPAVVRFFSCPNTFPPEELDPPAAALDVLNHLNQHSARTASRVVDCFAGLCVRGCQREVSRRSAACKTRRPSCLFRSANFLMRYSYAFPRTSG